VIALATVVAGPPPPAAAGKGEPDLWERARLDLQFPATLAQADRMQPADLPVPRPAEAAPAFGDKGSWRWFVSGGYGWEFQETHDEFVILGGGVSYFLANDLSLNFELNGLYFDQETESGFAD
jgi:hypothetical protein